MTHSLVPDSIVASRYRLEAAIGEGGMGAVWSAVESSTARRVALKFIRSTSAASDLSRRRFMREARAAMAVNHANVVRIHEVVRLDDGAPCMVMDLLVGETLAQRLSRTGRMSIGEFARIYIQIVSAVGTAHALGIVHRDLKPDNIFLVAGETDSSNVRVMDFGIAKMTASDGAAAATTGFTETGEMIGTPNYMSPEQVFGERGIDHKSDIWSLGIILYECLSGRRAVQGENMGQIFKVITTAAITPIDRVVSDAPRELTELCLRMLSFDRAKRPEDLREVYEIVARYTDVHPTKFGAPTPDPNERMVFAPPQGAETIEGVGATVPVVPRTTRPWVLWGPLAGIAVVGGVVAAIALTRHESAPSAPPRPSAASTPVKAATESADAAPSPTPTASTIVSSSVTATTKGTTKANKSFPKPSAPTQPPSSKPKTYDPSMP